MGPICTVLATNNSCYTQLSKLGRHFYGRMPPTYHQPRYHTHAQTVTCGKPSHHGNPHHLFQQPVIIVTVFNLQNGFFACRSCLSTSPGETRRYVLMSSSKAKVFLFFEIWMSYEHGLVLVSWSVLHNNASFLHYLVSGEVFFMILISCLIFSNISYRSIADLNW